MNRREVIAATGAVAATALAGCTASGQEGTETPQGTASGDGPGRTITVSSSGEVEGEPDLAVVQLSVVTSGDTAEEARSALAERSESVVSALVEYGIDEDDITTRSYRIHERVDRRAMERAMEEREREGEDGERPDPEEFTYYEGTHSLEVDVHDIETVGEVIDTAVEAGANEVDYVEFTLSDERRSELREEALREALGNARSEAETIAEEVDATVVEATVVDASEGRITPVRREPRAYEDAAATPTPREGSTEIESGDVTVTADVHVEYEMA